MNWKRWAAAGLSLSLLAGCGAEAQPVELPASGERAEIAYVPLDDRPDNVERVVYLAESLGYVLAMPEEDDFRTRLDGQPANDNGSQSGDRGDLYEWVLEQETLGCDRYVLSLDQLLSGGLVHSRAMIRHEDVVTERGTMTEYQLLERLLSTLAADPENQVWLLESVMRLAPTVGYQGGTMEDYDALRAYGAAPRPALSGEALTLNSVEEDYRLGADGQILALEDFDLTEPQTADYLSARARKLELSDAAFQMIRTLQTEKIHVLIGIDDSSVEDSIQKNEIAYLRSLLGEGDALLSGVDDLAFKAVTKLYLEEAGWEGASAAVRYFGGTEDRPACQYDSQALSTIVQEHMDFFQLEEASCETADLEILVLTQPEEEGQQDTWSKELVQAVAENQDQGRLTILIDAGNGRYGTKFHEALTKKTELGGLLSYAGFLDMAIVTGTAMSHGVARYAFLKHGTPTAETEAAFARTLADSVVKDFCYKNAVREDIIAQAAELGGNANNFWEPEVDRKALQASLEKGMDKTARRVLKNFAQSDLVVALEPRKELGWGTLTLSGYRFPWDRAFEIGMDLEVSGFTTPHGA